MAPTLAETLAARSRPPGFACAIGVYLSALDDQARADVLGAFRSPAVSARTMADWLREQGVSIMPNTVSHHRNGNCAGCNRASLDYRRPS